jgi:pyrimidine operon attenuation protein/uracil phosphoribosyltransferase
LNSKLPAVDPLIDTLCQRLQEQLKQRGAKKPQIVGVHTGGFWVAERLAAMLGIGGPIGAIDIGFHRDDFDERGLRRPTGPTQIEGIVEARTVVLVDDVLHTGRTVRAAINAIFEYGRPTDILLAALVSRGGRQLPIQADAIGVELDLPAGQRLKLTGPDPMVLTLRGEPHA